MYLWDILFNKLSVELISQKLKRAKMGEGASFFHVLAAVNTPLIDRAADCGRLFTTLLFNVEAGHKCE